MIIIYFSRYSSRLFYFGFQVGFSSDLQVDFKLNFCARGGSYPSTLVRDIDFNLTLEKNIIEYEFVRFVL